MDNCLFCKILKGKEPSDRVFENEFVYAFRDIAPQAPVHILVIPKKHLSSLNDLDDATDKDLAECLRAIRVIAARENLSNGYRVISNCGQDACQSVEHLHFHILAGYQMADKIVNLMKLSECPKTDLIKPTNDTYGYRWVYSNLHVYIVRIKINGEYCKNIFARNDNERKYEYFTEDWTIDEIRDAMLNTAVDRIQGGARAFMDTKVDYFVGNHIIGEPVFFCLSVDDFKKNQLKYVKHCCNCIKQAQYRLMMNH